MNNDIFDDDYTPMEDYIKQLYNENPQFCVHRTAYIRYVNEEEGPHFGFNWFVDSEIGKRYIQELLREKKLERLTK